MISTTTLALLIIGTILAVIANRRKYGPSPITAWNETSY